MVRGHRIRRKKGPVQAKKVTHDNIKFASGLEKYMYIALKKSKIKALYEGQTFELVEGFDFPFASYERCGNGKGHYQNRGNKKILKRVLSRLYIQLGPFTLYKPQNQKECDETVNLILGRKNN